MNANWKLILNGLLISMAILALAAINFVGYLLIREGQEERARKDAEAREILSLAYKVQIHFKIQVQEWKNTLLRGHRSEDFTRYFGQFQDKESRVQELCSQLLRNPNLPPSVRTNIDYFQRRHSALGEAYRNALQGHSLREPASIFAIDRSVRGIDRPPMTILDETVESLQASTRQQQAAAVESLRRLIFLLTLISAGCLLAAILLVSLFVIDRRRYERKLTAANKASRKADEAKSRFLAHMSHEIRTPLNGIVAAIDLLHEAELRQSGREALQVMRESAQSLDVIVNDILDFSRIDAGKITLHPEPLHLQSFLHILELSLRPLAEAKDLHLQFDCSLPQDRFVMADSVRVRQILMNLLSNAIKFTSEGFVRLQVEERESKNDSLSLRFVVTDSGVGIPEDKQSEIFKAFSRIDDSYTRRQQGTGLGLVICKGLTTAMGGRLHLQSTPGQGSVFTVDLTFPLAAASPSPDQEQPRENRASADKRPLQSVLLVDDVSTNRLVARRLLERMYLQPDTARNGREALHCAENKDYDLILMDCQMPEMDGYEATACIKQSLHQSSRPRPIIIAMTAHGMKDHREHSLRSGMDDHLTKPIRMESLSACLLQYFTLPAAPPLQAETTAGPRSS